MTKYRMNHFGLLSIPILIIALFISLPIFARAEAVNDTPVCEEHTWIPYEGVCSVCGKSVIPDFVFIRQPVSTLDGSGFDVEAFRSAFPKELEVKHEDGKYMIKDVGAAKARIKWGDSYTYYDMSLSGGWWSYEISAEIYESNNFVVEFSGSYAEGCEWDILYRDGIVDAAGVYCMNINTLDQFRVYYYARAMVDFIYRIGERIYKDTYTAEGLDVQEVTAYVNGVTTMVVYDQSGNVTGINVYGSDGWNYYDKDKGWYVYSNGEQVSVDTPAAVQGMTVEDIAALVPTIINCQHESYIDATCHEPQRCTLCYMIFGDPLGHVFSNTNCDLAATCVRCAETVGEPSEHSFSNGVCSTCGVKEENTIKINMRDSYGDGWTGNCIKIYENGKLLAVATVEDGTSGAFGFHYYSDREYELYWTDGSYSEECSFDLLIDGETVFSASKNDCYVFHDGYRIYPLCEHEWVKGDTVAPTCSFYGYTEYTCSLCNVIKEEDIVDPFGHTKSEEPIDVIDPTCTDYGYILYECQVCGVEYYNDTIAPLGHVKDEATKTVLAPTCNNFGYTKYDCSVCGKTISEDFVNYTGHTMGDDGLCTVCGEEFVYMIWVADVQLTPDNASDVFGDGTVSYDPATNSLTLNNFVYETDDEEICGIFSSTSLNIILKGENSINTKNDAIYFVAADSDISFRGDGSLVLITDSNGIDVYVLNNVSLTLGDEISIDFRTDNDEPIYIINTEQGYAKLTIEGNAKLVMGSEDAPLGEELIYIAYGRGADLIIKDQATVVGATNDEEGIYAYSDAENATVTIKDSATVTLTAAEEAIDSQILKISGGAVTLKSEGDYPAAEASVIVIEGGTVTLEGECGIYAEELTVSGGRLIATGFADADESWGIAVYESFTMSGGSVTASGTENGVYVCGELTVTGGRLELTGGGIWVDKYDEDTDTHSPGKITIGENMYISSPEGASVSSGLTDEEYTYTGIVGSDGAEVMAFVISELPVEEAAELSPWGIVGIAAGSTLAVGAGGFSLFWFVIKKKSWAELLSLIKK